MSFTGACAGASAGARAVLPEVVDVPQAGKSLPHKLMKGSVKTAEVKLSQPKLLHSISNRGWI